MKRQGDGRSERSLPARVPAKSSWSTASHAPSASAASKQRWRSPPWNL